MKLNWLLIFGLIAFGLVGFGKGELEARSHRKHWTHTTFSFNFGVDLGSHYVERHYVPATPTYMPPMVVGYPYPMVYSYPAPVYMAPPSYYFPY